MAWHVREDYGRYVPPKWIRPTVERLLAGIPVAYSSGLGAIVLTNSSMIGAGKTQRVAGRKYHRNACRGFYHRAYRGSHASITLVVDNILKSAPRAAQAFRPTRDAILANVLFHEIGHHLDRTLGAAAPSGEAAAENWRHRLGRHYFQRRYVWLRPLARALHPVVRQLAQREKLRLRR